MPGRMDKVEAALKREISMILHSDISDARIADLTITRVEVSRDLRNARVFYSVPDPAARGRDTAKALRSAETFVRRRLAARLPMKYIPSVSFREDDMEIEKERIERLFDSIHREEE